MHVTRAEPSFTADERQMLEGWLDYHRATLRWKCEVLSERQLRKRAVAPSNLSLMGLVRHMIEVERHWFTQIMTGERFDRGVYWTQADQDAEFNTVDSADVAADLALHESTCEEFRGIAATFSNVDELSSLSPNEKLISLLMGIPPHDRRVRPPQRARGSTA